MKKYIYIFNSETGTCGDIFIDRDGNVTEHFSEGEIINDSICVELECRGALLPAADGKFYPVRNTGSLFIPDTLRQPAKYFHEYCQQNRWFGFIYYEKYTTAQLNSLRNVLVNLCFAYNIPHCYNPDMWTKTGAPGIYSSTALKSLHTTNQVHPQPELLNLLKSL